jgi:LysR family transcriptional regulator, cys regulon transcriptional activator
MTLQQLRYLCAIAREGFSISGAANALGTSQPAISKQVRILEQVLGVELLIRRGNRILGLTGAGEAIIIAAQRTLWEAENLERIIEELTRKGPGKLTIATTHMYARYLLRPIIRDFVRAHPDVRLVLRQGTPSSVPHSIAAGDADIGFSGKSSDMQEHVLFLPCAELGRSIFMPKNHPLSREKKPTLKKLAQFPLIILDPSLEGGQKVMRAFEAAGIRPNVVLSAIDADVVKTYVELGLGIAVLLSVAYERERDRKIEIADASHLFPPTLPQVVLRFGKYLPGYMQEFIEQIAPQWNLEAIETAMRSKAEDA